MAKLREVETKVGGGAGFGAPDSSDDLSKMGNYEKAIMNADIFKMLAQLKVRPTDAEGIKKYQYLVLDETDIADLEATSFGAAGHKVNSQFACLGAPYRAIPFADENAQVVEREVTKGKHVGKMKKEKKTNSLKIYRTGEAFDSSLYAVAGWGKTNDAGEELVYESYTEGQEKRAAKVVAGMDAKLVAKVGIETE